MHTGAAQYDSISIRDMHIATLACYRQLLPDGQVPEKVLCSAAKDGWNRVLGRSASFSKQDGNNEYCINFICLVI